MNSILFNLKRRWVFYYSAKMFYVMILDLLSQFAVSFRQPRMSNACNDVKVCNSCEDCVNCHNQSILTFIHLC